jgi:hypothetical protein
MWRMSLLKTSDVFPRKAEHQLTIKTRRVIDGFLLWMFCFV